MSYICKGSMIGENKETTTPLPILRAYWETTRVAGRFVVFCPFCGETHVENKKREQVNWTCLKTNKQYTPVFAG